MTPISPPAYEHATRIRCGGGPITEVDAARFLTQATFGATVDTIAELQELGTYEAWIDAQLALPQSLTRPYTVENSNGSNRGPRHQIFWRNAVSGPDQLRQRLAMAWSELFVVSDIDYELRLAQYAISGYYDMLGEHATRTFREMLEAVTLSPVMGIYLSMLRNERADPERNVRPDENFAREVLQLFTIGLDELRPNGTPRKRKGKPIATFDQHTVEQFARVFTGWNLDGAAWVSNDLTKFDKESPMVAVAEFHDTGLKELLGASTPHGASAEQDLNAALDDIVAHSNVGPFIARHLIQRLVTSNPSPRYVRRVGEVFDDDGSGRRGDLAAVTRAVLLDREARSGHLTKPRTFGKIKEPIMRLTQLWRAFDVQPGPASDGVLKTPPKVVDQLDDLLGQAVLRSPSVFNFFLPDHSLDSDSGLVAPELAIHTDINVASTNNLLFDSIHESNNTTPAGQYATASRISIDREVALAADPADLVDHLDLLLLSGSMPEAMRLALVEHLSSLPDTPDGRIQRALDAVYCTIASPLHLVQK